MYLTNYWNLVLVPVLEVLLKVYSFLLYLVIKSIDIYMHLCTVFPKHALTEVLYIVDVEVNRYNMP